MKRATYKVNGVNGRIEILLRWLADAKLNVACQQELKAPDEKFPLREIERASYGALWHGQKSWNGWQSGTGPKFGYKLRWFERLRSYAAELFERDVPVALVGDLNANRSRCLQARALAGRRLVSSGSTGRLCRTHAMG